MNAASLASQGLLAEDWRRSAERLAEQGPSSGSEADRGAGLIRVYEYNDDGDRSGVRVKQGSSGTSYYVSAADYYGGANIYRKHLPTCQYSYPQATTDRSAASRITASVS
jgi:hypothetical protein